ncbi:MAG TPA: SusC/RagA family TonB-linked outer membrane protein [Chitinophagaceae bacterium]|nr:SusC/RagA family TonB-linked outer membrane protein [Chitinophagaceae bacterium]
MSKINYLLLLLFLIPVSLFAQTTQVRGVVRDSASGNPLSGVSVELRGPQGKLAQTITNVNGEYNFQSATTATVIAFSYTGMGTVEENINGRNDISIILAPSAVNLGDVVVVGYTSQRKETLTGAISTIKGTDMQRTRTENTLNMLTGKMPGVRVVQKSARPGAYDATIDIRGMGAGNPPTPPLFVIDGVVRDKDYFARMSSDEIETVTILKDGSAAVYGLRAGNGVVLVTTKTGKAQGGKVDITYNASYGIQQYLYVPQSVNTQDYMTLRNESNWQDFNGNYLVRRSAVFTDAQMGPYKDGTKRSYNWMDEVFNKDAPTYSSNLSVSGGSDKIRYYFNLDYQKQIGSYKSGDLKSERWAMRSNVDAQITKRLKARVQVGAILLNRQEPNGTGWPTYKATWLLRPDAPFYANDNPAYPNGNTDQLGSDGNNMIIQTNADYVGLNVTREKRYNGTLRLEYEVPRIKGLSIKGLYDYAMSLPDYNNYHRAYSLFSFNQAANTYNTIPRATPSTVEKGSNMSYDRTFQGGLYYQNSFERHNVNASVVYEATYNQFDGFSAYREILVASQYLFAGEDNRQRANGQTPSDRASRSMIGSVVYDFDRKYLLDFKFRYDGSSRFPDGKRFGFFPTVSAGWRLSEEPFIRKNLDFISELKLRGSYGEVGDDGSAGNYPPTIGYNLNPNEVGWYFGNPPVLNGGVTPSAIPNPNLTWYRIKHYDAAIDFGFLNNKITGTIEVFRRDRSGILATSAAVIPGTVGANLPQENLNNDRNFGYELSAAYRSKYRDLSFYVMGQISATKYMRTDWLETPAGNSLDKWRNRTANRYQNIWWGNESGGMFTSYDQIRNFNLPVGQGTLPGDWYLSDWNGDGVINGNDEHPIATMGLPVFNYGFSIGGVWRNFDVALDWQGAHGVYVQYAEVLTEALPFNGQNTLSWFMDRWHTEDPNADYFNPNTKWIGGYYPATAHDGRRSGSNGIMNASYIRLKTAELGYTFNNTKLLSSAGIKEFRVYVSGYNLLTFTPLEGVDPERPGSAGGASTNYIDFYNDPITRTYTVGLRLKF